jgi:CubicO group peptidase (beta-lactamase class C family)
MYLKTIVVLLCTQISLLAALQSQVASQVQPGAATDLLNSVIEQGKFVGVVAGFSVDGAIVWSAAAGEANIELEQKMMTSTEMRPASIAKPMTAVAIMQLCEQGKMGLDLPIQVYLPEFPKHQEGDITVRHLLNHTSGIGAYKGNESESNKQFESLLDAVAVFKDRPLLFEPGTEYRYTTYGYVVLGLMIERVSGLSYQEFMQKNIWDKIDMNETSIEDRSQDSDSRSNLYYKNRKGKIQSAKVNHLSNRIPGGGLESTVEDILKFGNAMLNSTIVSQKSLDMMWETPKIQNHGNPYGLGWTLYGENPKYGQVFGHSGGQTGSAAQLFILPEINTVIAVMANTSGAGVWEEVFRIGVQLFDVAAGIKK